MVRVTYYVAASLDGFIAKSDGAVDWLSVVEVDGEDYGYADFFRSVDGLLMGRATFDKARELGEWPYGTRPCWVWTRGTLDSKPEAVIETAASPSTIIETAQNQGLKHLWLVGGAQLASVFAAEKLITTYVVSIVPVILGTGVSLFEGLGTPRYLELMESRPYASGLVQLTLVPRADA